MENIFGTDGFRGEGCSATPQIMHLRSGVFWDGIIMSCAEERGETAAARIVIGRIP